MESDFKVYRGETIRFAQPRRLELLKKVLRIGYPAEFVNSGNPYLMVEHGFFDSAVDHVANDFNFPHGKLPKHFMSFSSDRKTAEKYALSQKVNADYLDRISNSCMLTDITNDLLSQRYIDSDWDLTEYLIVTVDMSKAKPIQDGFDFGRIKECSVSGTKLMGLNAANYFSSQKERMGKRVTPDVGRSAELSKEDREWLVLVLDLIAEQKGCPPSSSGIIKHGPLLRIEAMRREDGY